MQDLPTARELLDAAAQFLETELTPTVDDARLKFRTRVAANVLRIVARELEMGDAQMRAEYDRLQTLPLLPHAESNADASLREQLLSLNRELARRIRAGEADDGAAQQALVAHVRQTVIEKLQIANPRYLESKPNPA